MKYLIIVYAAIVVQTQCRSLLPTANMDESGKLWNPQTMGAKEEQAGLSLIDSPDVYIPSNFATAERESIEKKSSDNTRELKPFIVTQARKLEKFLSEYSEKPGNGNDYGTRAGQLLKQLKTILKEFSAEGSEKSKQNDVRSKSTDSSSIAKNFQDILSFNEDFGVLYQDTQDLLTNPLALPTISHARIFDEDATGNNKSEADQLDDMLLTAQNQIARIRKYFDVICRKHHHSMRASEMDNNRASSEITQPKKLSIL